MSDGLSSFMKSETQDKSKKGKEKEKKKGGILKMFGGKKKEKQGMSIGTPYGFEQNFHVGFDPTTGQFQVIIQMININIRHNIYWKYKGITT